MHEILKNRRSIRKYKPEQVSDAHLDAILEAAYTGSAFTDDKLLGMLLGLEES